MFVLCADYWLIRNGHDTMSVVFGDSVVHPVRRWYVMAAWGILTVHLFANVADGLFPDTWKRYDPIGALARQVRAKGNFEAKFSFEADAS